MWLEDWCDTLLFACFDIPPPEKWIEELRHRLGVQSFQGIIEAMAKSYRITFAVNSAQPEAATKRVEAGLLKGEQAAHRLAAALTRVYSAPHGGAAAVQSLQAQTQALRDQTQALQAHAAAGQKVARVKPGHPQTSAAAGQAPATTSAATAPAASAQAAAQRIALKSATAEQLQALEDRYLMSEVSAQTKHEAKLQKAGQNAAARAVSQKQKTAEGLQSLEDRYLLREQDGRNKHEAKLQKAGQNAAARAVSQKQKTAEGLQSLEDRYLLREQDGRNKHEARLQVRAERTTAQEAKQKQKSAEQLGKIEDRYLLREQAGRVAWQRKKAALEQKGFEASQERIEHFAKVGATMSATAAVTGLKLYYDAFHKITEESAAATEAVLKLRKGLGMEAALKGAGQADNSVVAESLKLRVATGLDQAEASELTKQYLGAVPAARDARDKAGNPHLTKDVEDQMLIQTGIMQARIGGGKGAGTRGVLAGLIAEHRPIKSVEQGMGILESIRQGLSEGIGDDTPLSEAFMNARGTLVGEGGMVPSDPELAALIGTTSLQAGGAGMADTRALQLARFTRGTGKKGMHAIQNIFGVKEQDNLEQRLDKIIPKLREQQAKGRAIPEFLIENGLTENSEDAGAVMGFMKNFETFKRRLTKAREVERTGGKEVLAQNQAYLNSAQGLHAQAEQSAAAAEVTKGVENRGEEFQALVKAKEASPEMQKANKSPTTQVTDLLWRGFGEFGGAEHGKQARLQEAVILDLQREAQRVGAYGKGMTMRFHGINDSNERRSSVLWDADARQKYAAGLMTDIQAKGGNPLAGGGADIKATMDANTKAMGELTKALNAQRPGGKPPAGPLAPPPLPGAPPGGPLR